MLRIAKSYNFANSFMFYSTERLEVSLLQSTKEQELKLIHTMEKEYSLMKYSFKQYELSSNFLVDDKGVLIYTYDSNNNNYLELQFCMSDVIKTSSSISEQQQTAHLFNFCFAKAYFKPFLPTKEIINEVDKVLSFQHKHCFNKMVPLCGRTRVILESIINCSYKNSLADIFIHSQIQTILLYSVECLVEDKLEGFTCKFLENENDRNKVNYAREILLKNLCTPITIKELSRLVGTNECYLKKGFKEMFGTTIFDFYQHQRMEYAKGLLYEKGISVTEVAFLLGYSSISHFSTAFRKHTGLKPCELLLR